MFSETLEQNKKKKKFKHYFLRLSGPVLYPHFVGLPHGVKEPLPWLPPLLLRPSPPPWGWSTGFIATPRTTGLLPNHRLCPAFLSFLAPWPGFETVPIVARHLVSISFWTPEGILTKTYLDVGSFSSFADVPAARTSFPPWPGFISMLWIIVPILIAASGMQLPIWEFMSRLNIWFIMLSRKASWGDSFATEERLRGLGLATEGKRSLFKRVDEAARALTRAIDDVVLDYTAKGLFTSPHLTSEK